MEPTREVFGNVAPWMQTLFYVLILAAIGAAGLRLWRRLALWRRGVAGEWERDPRTWIKRLALHALAQKRVHRRTLGGVLHALLFCGFVVLFIGTTLLFIADQGPVDFHHGVYYLGYEMVMDVFGLAFCVGCVLALVRRIWYRPESLGHTRGDFALLGLLLTVGVTGFLVEALRLVYSEVDPGVARWSTVGWALSVALKPIVGPSLARSLHLSLWWLHVVTIVALFVAIPYGRMLHAITGPLNIALKPSRHRGALAPLSLEEVEATGRIGVGAVEHFTRQQLMSLDACMECGRCQDVCPAYATGKPLSPKSVVVDLRNLMQQPQSGRSLHGETILAETLWACTMCQACVAECPVFIGHVDLVSDLRRNLVGESQLAGTAAQALRRTGNQSNPHGQPQQERLAWADGLEVPTVQSNPQFEYLLWVGCAAAFDPRAQKVARATVTLLKRAGVSFAVLGTEEKCTGDPARRLGEEFLFQQLASENVETLCRHGARKIVTPCPHCFNTLGNEYPQFGGVFEVQHHSQLLAELLRSGRIQPAEAEHERPTVTLHDPCYLARVNGEVVAPRAVVAATTQTEGPREMQRHGANTFCCGAGGGRMWFEEPAEQRVSALRAREAVETGSQVLATACPFCLNMLSDAMHTVEGGEKLRVLDVAELLAGTEK